MNFLLKTRDEILDATKYLQENGLIESEISAKNWEIAQVVPYMRDGNWIDFGSSGSVVIPNLLRKGIKGSKVGIDLAYQENFSRGGVDYIAGDLTSVPYPPGFFNFISCLSVIEHNVNFEKLAKECSRLLSRGGQLFLSFDYWDPSPDTSKMKLYSLDWTILDAEAVGKLSFLLHDNGFDITTSPNLTTKDAVINDTYCSPVAGVSYTFGILHFIKQ